jgi:hypothetical protein
VTSPAGPPPRPSTPNSAGSGSAAAVVDGIAEWLALVEDALQGLNHALNNRIGSLAALVELYHIGDLPDDGTPFRTVASDVSRLEDCTRLVRLLPADAFSGEEAVLLTDVLADVLAIVRFVHDTRETKVMVTPTPFVEPVRVERWALVRALALLLAGVKRQARSVNTNVQASMESSEQWVQIEMRLAGAPRASDQVEIIVPEGGDALLTSRYAAALAATMGGTVTIAPGCASLRLPTLKARRIADRR